jgi:hypothetical protein
VIETRAGRLFNRSDVETLAEVRRQRHGMEPRRR